MKNNNSNGCCLITIILLVMFALFSIALAGCYRTNTSNDIENELAGEPQCAELDDTAHYSGFGTTTFIKSFVGADRAAEYVDDCYAKFGESIVNVSMASNDYYRANMLVIMVTVKTETYVPKDTR